MDIYQGGQRHTKKMTKKQWKQYLQALRDAYKAGDRIKRENEAQHKTDMIEAEKDLASHLETI